MNIITVTLNPAFDMHCYTENFQPFHENLAKITACEAGGKGINISRALTVNGVDNVALAVVGEENEEAFIKSLRADKMDVRSIRWSGRIRENITLHTNNAPETRISFSGFVADDSLVEIVEKELEVLTDGDTVLTFTGRNPEGVSIDATKEMLKKLKARGVKIIIDSRSFGKDDLIDVAPWLIKPNEEEIAMYTDVPVNDFESAKKAAEALRAEGIENVMISLGSKGAMLSCIDGCYVAHAPKIKALSTIGAGDSSIGGFCAAAKLGLSYPDMLRYAVCYGSAACMTEGTRPPKRESVEKLLNEVQITSL
ncbi:MAG: hexose kinase [Clostridia bacterium]|nr:hexose kinase [Clostridia bacterium]